MNKKNYTYFDMEKHPSIKELVKALGITTVPIVFADGERIGGYQDTKDFIKWMNTHNQTT